MPGGNSNQKSRKIRVPEAPGEFSIKQYKIENVMKKKRGDFPVLKHNHSYVSIPVSSIYQKIDIFSI